MDPSFSGSSKRVGSIALLHCTRNFFENENDRVNFSRLGHSVGIMLVARRKQ